MPFVRTTRTVRPIHPLVRAYLKRRGMGQDSTDTTVGLPTDVFSGGSSTDILNLPVDQLPVNPLPIQTPAPTGPSGLQTFLADLPGLLSAGVRTAQSIQGPGLVPGTNAIYNPLTGQYYNPSTGQVVNPTGASTLGITDFSSFMPIILIGGGLFLVAMMFGGKR